MGDKPEQREFWDWTPQKRSSDKVLSPDTIYIIFFFFLHHYQLCNCHVQKIKFSCKVAINLRFLHTFFLIPLSFYPKYNPHYFKAFIYQSFDSCITYFSVVCVVFIWWNQYKIIKMHTVIQTSTLFNMYWFVRRMLWWVSGWRCCLTPQIWGSESHHCSMCVEFTCSFHVLWMFSSRRCLRFYNCP